MSFPAYEFYQDTGVEWFPRVPSHWNITKLGRLLNDVPCYGVLVPDFQEDGVPMLRITDMEAGNADRESLNTISPTLSDQYSRTLVEVGDVVLSVVGTIGVSFKVEEHLAGVNLSRAVARIQVGDDLLADYLCWAFRTTHFTRYVDLICTGTAQRVLNMGDLAAFRIPVPSPNEQHAIAVFLDTETSKIDALVAEQRRLIALLKEKRQAVISHAVTKGLNPDAPMKDSGIEWLGDVPEHWEVVALKHFARLKSGDGITGENIEESGDYPVFGGNGLRGFTNAFTHDGHYVIIGRQGALCGNVNYGQGKFWASEHAVVATPTRNLDTVWLGEMIRSMNLNQYSETAAQPGLSMVAVGNFRTILPPRKEQREIADFVTKKTAEFDTLSAEAEQAITLLQERRTALISAAVTGKIDVREFAGEEAA